ncbi:MAG: GAP family protein [Mycobacterium sp.]|nr:GAP family protein [Mycobacterium sp.]
MSSHLAVLASLALAIFLSPETLVVGLIMAGDRKVPRLAAMAFAIGGVLGIAFATGIGLWIAHLAGVGAGEPKHHGWPGFVVRVLIAAALLAIGARRAFGAVRKKPIDDISEPGYKPGRVRTALTEHFPALARQLDLNADLPTGQRLGRAGAAGFAMCGLHPKVFPIAIAAGHQIVQIGDGPLQVLAVVMFGFIAVVPALLPMVIDLINPRATTRIKVGYEQAMKVHGRWITATLLLAAGSFLAFEAWDKMPGR